MQTALKQRKQSDKHIKYFQQFQRVTVQESKLRQNGIVKLDRFHIFEMHRTGMGGGC